MLTKTFCELVSVLSPSDLGLEELRGLIVGVVSAVAEEGL